MKQAGPHAKLDAHVTLSRAVRKQKSIITGNVVVCGVNADRRQSRQVGFDRRSEGIKRVPVPTEIGP